MFVITVEIDRRCVLFAKVTTIKTNAASQIGVKWTCSEVTLDTIYKLLLALTLFFKAKRQSSFQRETTEKTLLIRTPPSPCDLIRVVQSMTYGFVCFPEIQAACSYHWFGLS